jgi:DNA-binding transcriptional MerR regulator
MDKSPDAFRTISEVAEEMDLPQHVLRFWETRFPQIKPLKRGGGRRYYRPDDVDLLRAVKQLLYGEGYTIKGVQKLLREQGAAMVARGLVAREGAETTKAASAAVEKPDATRPAADARPAAQRSDVLREAERLLSLPRSG